MRVPLVAGCGSGSVATAPVSRRPATPTATTVAPPATTATRPATTTPTKSQAPTASSFEVDLTVQRAGLGLLALTNTSGQPVRVQGWPVVAFYNAADEPVAVPIRKVSVPGAGPSVTVGPGETAFAGLRWTVGDKADPKTFVATTLTLTPPGTTGAVTVHVIGSDGTEEDAPEFDVRTAEVGTVQPSSQGVLVF
jgi:hypothetical protein